MSATLIGSFVPGSPEWHAARRDGVGGSEIAAILGLSPWESRFSLWHRKRGEIAGAAVTASMEWGTRLEPAIVQAFYEKHQELQPAQTNGSFRNDGRPWQIANPDSLARHHEIDSTYVVEVKTARYDDEWGKAGSDQIPIHYRCQVLWYMDCLGIARSIIPVLIAGSDYREYVVEYDHTEALYLREQAAQFMDDLANDVRPDIDAHAATYSTVKALPEGATGETAEISVEMADRYRLALDHFSHAEDFKRKCTTELLDAIGDGKYAATPDGTRIALRSVTKDGRTHSLRPCKEPTT